MSLNINPQAQLVAEVSQRLGAGTNSGGNSNITGELSASQKNQTASNVERQSGGGTSGLGPGAGGGAGGSAGSSSGSAGGAPALGGTGSPIQSLASKAQGVAAGIANPAAFAAQAIDKLGASSSLGGLVKLATTAAAGAGVVNNLLGLFRSKNIPSGADILGKSNPSSYVDIKPGLAEDWRIRIDCNFGLFGNSFDRLAATSGFVWPYLPNITLSTKANYTQLDPVHNIQPFQAYKNSQVEDIQISGDFTVENEFDAEYWIQATTFLRTATKMFFGASANPGNPPIICNLTGYGARVFNNVPIVIKSFSIDFKEDVNYMRYGKDGGAPTWVPVISTISVTVSPIYNRTRLRQFSLQDFAAGKAIGYI
jgi:hypothetical protein